MCYERDYNQPTFGKGLIDCPNEDCNDGKVMVGFWNDDLDSYDFELERCPDCKGEGKIED